MRLFLRSVAVLIAVAGAIDPRVFVSRTARPVIALVVATPADRALADRVTHRLSTHFDVTPGPDAGASAVVAVGRRVPPGMDVGAVPAFAVLPVDASIAIARVTLPDRAPLEARIPVDVQVQLTRVAADARLVINGTTVDHVRLTKPADRALVTAALGFVPTTTGLTRVRVDVTAGSEDAVADAAIEIVATRREILSFDPRPSWASTFVRRALEDDPRVHVTSRVAMAPRAIAETGAAPASLGGSLEGFSVILVGAPDLLTDEAVSRLEAFARTGGAVCLIVDRVASGPYERLARASTLTERTFAMPVSVDPALPDQGRLRATEFALPSLGSDVTPLAAIATPTGRQTVVWRTALGNGDVIVSTALDAWRYRGDPAGDFAGFWRRVAEDAADASRSSLDLRVGRRLLGVGETLTVRAAFGGALAASHGDGAIRVQVAGPAGDDVVRMWPDAPGYWVGTWRAPERAGVYRLTAAGEDDSSRNESEHQAHTDVMVAAEVATTRDDPDLIRAWATAHGGAVVTEANLSVIDAAIMRAAPPRVERAAAYPMRSGWWILAFAGAAGGEWWLRRRAGGR